MKRINDPALEEWIKIENEEGKIESIKLKEYIEEKIEPEKFLRDYKA